MKSSEHPSYYTIRHLNPLNTFKNLWKFRDLIFLLAQRNIVLRYKGTFLGFFWMIITPVLMLTVYLFVSIYIFKAQWTGPEFTDPKAARALIMFCSIIIFNMFSETVNSAAASISGNRDYVKKTIFPLEILPLANVASTFFFGLIWTLIILVCSVIFLKQLCFTALIFPVVFFLFFLFCSGIAWFISSAGVYVRDIVHITSVLLQLLFFATPICYSLEMVPERFRGLMYLNPLTTVISSIKKILLFNQWPDWTLLGLIGLASLIVFQLGYCFFVRTKGWFADVL